MMEATNIGPGKHVLDIGCGAGHSSELIKTSGATVIGVDAAQGMVVADDNTGQTSKRSVFAGGDIVTGGATVISAMGAGRRAAAAIDDFLRLSPACTCFVLARHANDLW